MEGGLRCWSMLGTFGEHFGAILEAFFEHFGASWEHLSCACFCHLILCLFWAHLGLMWPILGYLGFILGSSWALLGPSRGIQEGILRQMLGFEGLIFVCKVAKS